MDPEATLKRVVELLRDGDPKGAAEALDDYFRWREKGGFQPKRGDVRAARLWRAIMHARPKRVKNPKRRRFHKPKLRRAFVEDDGHVFAKPDATGYLGKIKANPKRKKRRSLVPKSRPVPRWLIKAAHKSVAKQRKMKNPVRITSPRAGSKRQFRVYTRKLSGPWALTVKTNSVKHALDSAGKLETRGYRVRVTQVR